MKTHDNAYSLVILAAGLGTRFGGDKQIAEIDSLNKTIMEISIEHAHNAGIQHVVLVVNDRIEPYIRTRILPRIAPNIDVDIAVQSVEQVPPYFKSVTEKRTKPWGTGHALLAAKPYVQERFIVITADDYYGESAFSELLLATEQGKYWAMLGYPVLQTLSAQGGVNRGICQISHTGFLTRIDEHINIVQEGSTLTSNLTQEIDSASYVSMTIWALDYSIFEYLENNFINFLKINDSVVCGEYYLPDQIQQLITQGQACVKVKPAKDAWLGVTYHHEFENVAQQLTQLIKNKPQSCSSS